MMIILPYTTLVQIENKNGKVKIVKKSLKRHSQIEIEDILDVTEYVNKNGSINPNKCIIQHKDLGLSAYDVSPSYLWDIRKKLVGGFEIQGFKIEKNEKNRENKTGKRRISRKINRK